MRELVCGKVSESQFEGANKRTEHWFRRSACSWIAWGNKQQKTQSASRTRGAHLVVCGEMAQGDVWVPPFLPVCKDIHVRGFWRTSWFNTLKKRSKFLDELVRLMVSSKVTSYACCHVSFDRADRLGLCQFQEQVHEIVKIEGTVRARPTRQGKTSGQFSFGWSDDK